MLAALIRRERKNFQLLFGFTVLVLVYEAIIALIIFLFTGFPFDKPFINPFYLLLRWDSWHYIYIIQNGYISGKASFFPLYPAVVDFFSLFTGNMILAGFFVSWASLTFALFYFWKLLIIDNSIETSKRTLLLLLFFPFAVFFSAFYAESLFIFLAIAFFYYLKKEKWMMAAGAGLLAALARPVGFFLFPVMLWRYWEIFHSLPFFGKFGRERLKEKLKFLGLAVFIPLATASYCLFCYIKFGHPLAFVSGQTSVIRAFYWPWDVFSRFYGLIFVQHIAQTDFYYFFRAVIVEASSFLLLFVATIYFFCKKENLYGIFCGLNLVLFSAMFPLASVNRYILVIFPLYLFMARIARKDFIFFPLLAFFMIIFVFTVYTFSTGAWAG